MPRRLLLLTLFTAAFLAARLRPSSGAQADPSAPIAIPFAVDGARALTSVDAALFLCHPGTSVEPVELTSLVVTVQKETGLELLHTERLVSTLASDPAFVAINAEIERMPHELAHRDGPRYFAAPDDEPWPLPEAIERLRALEAALDSVRAGYAAGGPRPFAELHFALDLAAVFEPEDAPGSERAVTFELTYRSAGGSERTLALEHRIRRLAPFGTPATLAGTTVHAGDLHVHSCHGEATNACAPSADCAAETLQTSGSFTYAQLKTQYQALGLDWMTATDHSYCINDDAEYLAIVAETAAISDGAFLAIPDIELSSSEQGPQTGSDTSDLLCLFGDAQNHMGAHGITARKPGGSDGFAGFCNGVSAFDANVAAIRAEGGYAVANHPSASAFGWNSVAALTGQEAAGLHGIEIWNGPFVSGQGGDVGAWVSWLLGGRVLFAYSGSDTHDAAFDFGANHVLLDGSPFTEESLESALKAGRLYVSNGPALVLEVGFEGTTLAMGTRKGLSPTQPASPLSIDVHYDFGAGSGVVTVYRGYAGDASETVLCQSAALGGTGVFSCADTLDPSRQGWYRAYAGDGPSQTAAYTNPVFFLPTSSAWTAYGQGLGGANVGTLASDSAPFIGCTQRFEASGFAPSTPSVTFLVYGTQLPGGFPLFGGFLLIAPPYIADGLAPASGGAAVLEATIPLNPVLIGLDAYVQALAFSPNPFGNIGFTNGLAGTVGGL